MRVKVAGRVKNGTALLKANFTIFPQKVCKLSDTQFPKSIIIQPQTSDPSSFW